MKRPSYFSIILPLLMQAGEGRKMSHLLIFFMTLYGIAIGLLFIGRGIYLTIQCRLNVGTIDFYKAQALFLVGLVAVVWIGRQTEEFLLYVQRYQPTDAKDLCGVFGQNPFLWPKACQFTYTTTTATTT